MHLAPTLESLGAAPRAALDAIAADGFRFVQLSATQPGLRPRELDRSARRDLMAFMRRRELGPAGIDLWIPPAHYLEAHRVDRATMTAVETIELAADLGTVPVSVALPRSPSGEPVATDVNAALTAAARRYGVRLADHALPVVEGDEAMGVGIDPATWLERDADPVAGVLEHAERLVSVRLLRCTGDGGRSTGRDETAAVGLDLRAYRVALSVAAYARPVVVDARQWSEPWGGLRSVASAWAAVGEPGS